MSNIVVTSRVVSITEFLSVDANGAEIEQVDVKVIRILPGDSCRPIIADLGYTDCMFSLEDVKE